MNISELIKSLFSKKAKVAILTIGKVSKKTLGGGHGYRYEKGRPGTFRCGTTLPE